MTALDDFTPLESLLLFQSLHAWGVEADSFTKIAERLNASSLFDNVPKERFNPTSLRELYFKLLKEEAEQEVRDALDREGSESHGDSVAPSRKRKAQSPPLPTVEDATRHRHLVPKLVEKLYSRYVAQTSNEIWEEEERYDELVAAIRAEEETNGSLSRPDLQDSGHQYAEADIKEDHASVKFGEGKDGMPNNTGSYSGLEPRSEPKIDAILNHTSESALDTVSAKNDPSEPENANAPTRLKSPSTQPPSQPLSQTQLDDGGSVVPPMQETENRDQSSSLAGVDISSSQHPTSDNVKQHTTHHDHTTVKAGSARLPPVREAQSGSSIERRTADHPHLQSSQKGGVILPPFQLAHQSATSPTHSQVSQEIQTPVVTRTLPLNDAGSNLHSQPTPTSTRPKMTAQQIAQANTPSRVYGLEVVVTPGSSTGWKTNSKFGSTSIVERPNSRSISPISDTEDGQPSARQVSVLPGGRPGTTSSLGFKLQEHVPGDVGGSKLSRSSRAASRASSTISHIKNEPGTPGVAIADDSEANEADTIPADIPTTKRKRAETDGDESVAQGPESPKKGYIVATRNFSRTTGSLMNNITSHKHASLFANPIRAKDAEGYPEIVYRPQDLKSIRTMITIGHRTVAAATIDALQSSPGGQGSNDVILPISADLMPPRAIVNADQLEKEIMRMFANAVMFNPGDEDIVTEAREMCETVEKHVAEWRQTVLGEDGRGSTVKRPELDTDELGGDEDGETSSVAPGPAKRRRL